MIKLDKSSGRLGRGSHQTTRLLEMGDVDGSLPGREFATSMNARRALTFVSHPRRKAPAVC